MISKIIYEKEKLFIYLLGNNLFPPVGVGAHQRQGKREEGKAREKSKEEERDRGTEGETSSPTWPVYALIGEEEQNGKRKKKKEMGSGTPTQLPWT